MKPLFYYSIVLFLFFSATIMAQKKQVLTDEEQVTEMVTKEMDELFKSKDFLKQKDKKFKDIKGTIVTDVGIIQSGKVSTFFKVDSEIDNPNFTNFLSLTCTTLNQSALLISPISSRSNPSITHSL